MFADFGVGEIDDEGGGGEDVAGFAVVVAFEVEA